jgi:structural maintenance of chromosome 4
MMKPKGQTAHEEGLLEYLEDIIGSNKYVEKIEEVSKEVQLPSDTCSSSVQCIDSFS